MLRIAQFAALLLSVSSTVIAAEPELRLTLPPVCYAVAGEEMSVYFDNLVLSEEPEKYDFQFETSLGKSEPRRWTVTPAADTPADSPVRVKVVRDGKAMAEGTFVLHVAKADAGKDRELALLMVGDSLTHATVYPNEISRLLSRPGNPRTTLLGTHRPAGASEGVRHEGYGGWTWERFVTHYEPMPDPAQRKHSSPFVFLDGTAPKLDVARYIREKCGGRSPDCVTFLLGINDCFSAKPDDPAAIDQRIDAVLKQADILLAEFHRAAPNAELGVCLTTAPNSRESGFEANYKGAYHRWGWKRIQHRLVERELKHFAGREKEKILIVPTELNLDPVDGYPADNGVHPNPLGYRQIAASIYAWLKSRMEAQN